MPYNLQAITRAWVAKLADAQDSGSCEQYAHVGSSPVPRTTKPRYSIGCAEVLFLWRIRSRRDLNGRKRQQSIRIVAPPRRDSADNATLHRRFVILCRARNYYRLSSGASPVPRTIVAARRTSQQLSEHRRAVCMYACAKPHRKYFRRGPRCSSSRRENARRSLAPRFSLRCKTVARSLIFAPRN